MRIPVPRWTGIFVSRRCRLRVFSYLCPEINPFSICCFYVLIGRNEGVLNRKPSSIRSWEIQFHFIDLFMCKISVITINFNNKEGLSRTLQSVFSQTCENFEYIVVDGGSTDGSKLIIEENSSKIDRWISEPDKGVYHAMNKGVRMAMGEYVLFMNSGDVFYSETVLERALPILKTKSIYAGDIYRVDSKDFVASPKHMFFHHIISNPLCHQAVFTRRDLLIERPYNEDNKIVSDWEWFFRELVFYDASYEKIDLCVAKYDESGISSRPEMQELRLEEIQKAQKRYLPRMIRDAVLGESHYGRRIMYGLQMESPWKRDKVVIYNAVRMFLNDVLTFLKNKL